MTAKQIKTIFLVILIIILFILVFLILKPFLTLILWATLLTIMIRPLYNRIINKINFIRKRDLLKKVVAALFAFLVVLIIVLPIVFVFYKVAVEVKQFYIWFDNLLKSTDTLSFENLNNFIERLVYKISGISISFNLVDEITKFIKSKSLEITPIITTLISKIFSTIVGLFFLVITIFFMLTDGEILVKYFKDAIPIENNYIDSFTLKVYQVMDVIIKGYFVIAFYQAIVLFILLIIFKYQNPFLFSTLAFISSFMPFLGATIVWLPIAFLIGATQSIIKGIIFGLLCGFFVSTMDNFIRPLLISNKIKIHPLLLFFSIIGGILAFNYNGVILGPLFLALLYSSLEIIKMQAD